MDNSMTVGLQDELIADLTTELSGEPTFDASILRAKVINAIKEVKKARKYPSYYPSYLVDRDLDEYYSNIRNIALYDYNMVGTEGQQSHSENGISRSYVDRNSLFNGVLPITRL